MSRLENDLEFLEEPNAEDLRAVEELGDRPAQRRALVVLVADHALSSGEDTDRLVTELLQEDGFAVDAVVRVQSKRSLICQAIETAVIGGADLVITVGGTGVGPRDKPQMPRVPYWIRSFLAFLRRCVRLRWRVARLMRARHAASLGSRGQLCW